MHIPLEFFLPDLFLIRHKGIPFDVSIIDLECHLENTQPILALAILDVLDVFLPREETATLDCLLAEDQNVLLVL